MFRLNNEEQKTAFKTFAFWAVVSLVALIISLVNDSFMYVIFLSAFVVTGALAYHYSVYFNKNEKKLLKEGILLKNVQVDVGDYEQSFGKLLKVVLPNNKAYAFNLTAKDISAIGDNPHVDILFDPNNPLCFIIQHEIEVIGEVEPGRVIDLTPVLTPEAEAIINNQEK